MMIFRYVWLCCLAVVLSIHGCCGEDGDNCSYLYEGHTSRIECPSGNGGTIINCVVTVIRDFPTEIRWYQSQDEASAGVSGSLVEEQPGKYTLLENLGTSSSAEGLFQDEYQLEISNINEGDVGYYWCQIVVNVSCNSANTTILLEASDPWNITIGTLFLDCTGMDSTLPKCAETNVLSMPCGGSLETTVFASTRSITPTLPIPPTTATLSQNSLFGMSGLSPSQTSTVRPDPEQTPSTGSAASSCGGVSCFAVVGIVLFVTFSVCAFIAFVIITAYILKKKRKIPAPLEMQATTKRTAQGLPPVDIDDNEYSYPELQEHIARVPPSSERSYQSLTPGTVDYVSMYTRPIPPQPNKVPAVERDGHLYAVCDTTSIEPPSQYQKLQV